MGQLSLTTRLIAHFLLCSAAVLSGLGVAIVLAMDQHFVVENYTALRENVSVAERIVESGPVEQVPECTREAVQYRIDLIVHIQGSGGRMLYVAQDFDFQAVTQALA